MTPIQRFFGIIESGIRAALHFIETPVSGLLSAMGQIARGLLRVSALINRLVVYIMALASVMFMGLDLRRPLTFLDRCRPAGLGAGRVCRQPAA